jgi:hypothetical protein
MEDGRSVGLASSLAQASKYQGDKGQHAQVYARENERSDTNPLHPPRGFDNEHDVSCDDRNSSPGPKPPARAASNSTARRRGECAPCQGGTQDADQ